MAETWYPNPGVTQRQHELLMGGGFASGVVGHPADQGVVYAPNSGTREIRIRANRRAVVEGYGWENDAFEVVKNLAANSSGSTRVDLVVLRLDRATWEVTAEVVQGTPGAGAPSATYGTGSSGVWELPLAEVTVASGATTLGTSTVANKAWYVGSDGQIRCMPTTRPPHEAGRAVWDTTYGYLVSTGGTWLVGVEDSGTTGWTMSSGFTATLQHVHRRNGWAFADLSFRRSAAGMNGGTAYTVARLPDGFRPPFTYQTNAHCPSAQVNLTVAVFDTGYINVNPGVDVPANRAIVLNALQHPVA